MSDILFELSQIIKKRKDLPEKKSYASSLLNSGLEKCTEKFGEEAIELIVASLSKNREEFNSEAADVIFHLLILIEANNSRLEDILKVLDTRKGTSGLIEKQSRQKN